MPSKTRQTLRSPFSRQNKNRRFLAVLRRFLLFPSSSGSSIEMLHNLWERTEFDFGLLFNALIRFAIGILNKSTPAK